MQAECEVLRIDVYCTRIAGMHELPFRFKEVELARQDGSGQGGQVRGVGDGVGVFSNGCKMKTADLMGWQDR